MPGGTVQLLELPAVLKTIRIKFVPFVVKKFVVCA